MTELSPRPCNPDEPDNTSGTTLPTNPFVGMHPAVLFSFKPCLNNNIHRLTLIRMETHRCWEEHLFVGKQELWINRAVSHRADRTLVKGRFKGFRGIKIVGTSSPVLRACVESKCCVLKRSRDCLVSIWN